MIPDLASTPSDGRAAPRGVFATTRWSIVLAAGRDTPSQAGHALDELCRVYWYPLYVYIRRQGYSREDGEDLAQGFFASFLKKNYLGSLGAERGKFRAFLLASLKHYLASEYQKATRQKRGGTEIPLSLDWDGADSRYRFEPADQLSPDRHYDRAWTLALLERVIVRLQNEFIAEGNGSAFEILKPFLTADRAAIPYAEAAANLGVDEGTARVAVHRLRQRYRQMLRDEIAETLADRSAVEEELQSLFRAFS